MVSAPAQRTGKNTETNTVKEHVLGSEGTAPSILNLGITQKWAVSFKLRPLYPLNMSMGGFTPLQTLSQK
jgi:hypothetical protein